MFHWGTQKRQLEEYRKAIAHLGNENKKMGKSVQNLNAVLQMIHSNRFVIGIDELRHNQFITVVSGDSSPDEFGSMTVQLLEMPRLPEAPSAAWMGIQLLGNGGAFIVDWNAVPSNCGRGTLLMKNLLRFLAATGFLYISGHISPVDYDHLSLLEHFYRDKFGFTISNDGFIRRELRHRTPIRWDVQLGREQATLEILNHMITEQGISEAEALQMAGLPLDWLETHRLPK